jgi:hypothetical protein
MHDQELAVQAISEAQRILEEYLEPKHHDSEGLLDRLVEVLERPSVLVAVDRLRRGAGQWTLRDRFFRSHRGRRPLHWFFISAADGGSLSYDRERDCRSQNDQRIYASDHDAEINIGHEVLRLELDLSAGHCTFLMQFPHLTSRGNRDSVPLQSEHYSLFQAAAKIL